MKKITMIVITVILIFAGVNLTFGETVSKNENVSYKEITISKGDTLWNISEKYKNDGESVKDYVNKIMEFNNMKNDRINAGQKLIVIINS